MKRFPQAAGILGVSALMGCGFGTYSGPPRNSVYVRNHELTQWNRDVNRDHLRQHFRSLYGPDAFVVFVPGGVRIYHSLDGRHDPWTLDRPRVEVRNRPINPLEGIVGYTPWIPPRNTRTYTPQTPREPTHIPPRKIPRKERKE